MLTEDHEFRSGDIAGNSRPVFGMFFFRLMKRVPTPPPLITPSAAADLFFSLAYSECRFSDRLLLKRQMRVIQDAKKVKRSILPMLAIFAFARHDWPRFDWGR